MSKSKRESLTIRIGGEAGVGLAAAAEILARVFVKLGYHIFSSKEYASQIRGGHNYHTLRISTEEIGADVDKVDVLLAFDPETVEKHGKNLASENLVMVSEKKPENSLIKNILVLPVVEIEKKLQDKNLANTIFLGATGKSLGVKWDLLEKVIKEFFKEKIHHVERNLKAAKSGYDFVTKESSSFFLLPHPNGENAEGDFLSGNEAIVKGAIKAGIKFHAQYPMTPVSGILHFLAQEAVKNKELKVIQPEDEIAGINLALGASYAGARAMVATSGGGLALMVEGLGLAGMAEIPLVIIEGQRPGPATGLPTKTEQGDLKFVLSAGVGDFPKVVLAPGDVEESYTETKRAFYLAEKYQLPVIILIDKHLAESFKTINLDAEEKKFNLDFSLRWGIVDKVKENGLKEGMFPRYQEEKFLRTLPGTPLGMYTCAGDEHDEVGEITEEPAIRKKMMERRISKLDFVKEELPEVEIFGPENSSLLVVGWGSTKKAIKEAIQRLNKEGQKINFLQVKYLLPFGAEKIKEKLISSPKLVLVENNYSAQLGSLIREKTGIEIKDQILRYDGKTFSVDELYLELKKRC